MAGFREMPTPTYDYEISILVGYYEDALRDLQRELSRIDLNTYQRANIISVQNEVRKILQELDENAAAWVANQIPIAVQDGITRTLISLEVATTIAEATEIMKFNRLNNELIKTIVADTQSDLMQISQNIDRRVRNTIREVTAEVLRSNVTKGINGRKALTSDIVTNLRAKLGDSVNTGIIDTSGRRWNPKIYAEMVVRTKTATAHREAMLNESLSRKAYYGVISRHGAHDACRLYEGKIVKLTPDAPGGYPYMHDLPRREIFHPNCKHLVTPIRKLDYLPNELKQLNGVE